MPLGSPSACSEPGSGLDSGLEALVRRLLDLVSSIMQFETTYLTRIDWDRDVQRIVAARDGAGLGVVAGVEIPWSQTLCRRALESGTSATDDVLAAFPDCEVAREIGIRSYATAPVYDADGEVYGTLCGASPGRVGVTDEGRDLLVILAEMITLQFSERSARLVLAGQAEQLEAANRRLERLTVTDELTGLVNRRGVMDALRRMVASADRRARSMAVLAVDVDRFKHINDRFGHPTGDRVLVELADALRAAARVEDIVGRLGGDEFVVLMAEADEQAAAALAARVRLAAARVRLPDGSAVAVSVGAGVAENPSVDGVLADADRALYGDKAARTQPA